MVTIVLKRINFEHIMMLLYNVELTYSDLKLTFS
jgi:hypothetical protein